MRHIIIILFSHFRLPKDVIIDLLNPKSYDFVTKNDSYFAWNVALKILKLQTHFLKNALVNSSNIFYLLIVIYVSWYFISYIRSFYTLGFKAYQLIFGDKAIKAFGLHSVWIYLTETLKTEPSVRTFKKSLNDCFRPKWKCSLNVSKKEK